MLKPKVVTDKETILEFLRGNTPDTHGRTYKDSLSWTDEELEECHDQVQYLFPLHEPSHMAIGEHPVLSPEVVEAGKQDPAVIDNLLKGKDRFEKFYGIGPYNDPSRHSEWCAPRNHNLLRITRMIRTLRLFGLEEQAQEFYKNVLAVESESGCPIEPLTKLYWFKAASDDVWETLR